MPPENSHKGKWNTDKMIGFGLLLFSATLYFFIIPREMESRGAALIGLNPAFIPKLLTIILAGLSLLLIYTGRQAEEDSEGIRPFTKPVWLTLVFLAIYAYAMEPLGYLITTALTLAGFLYFFGTRNKLIIGCISIAVPLILYWFFGEFMLIALPTGTLFE
jgi:putative tricarboxylic transport membrane protein